MDYTQPLLRNTRIGNSGITENPDYISTASYIPVSLGDIIVSGNFSSKIPKSGSLVAMYDESKNYLGKYDTYINPRSFVVSKINDKEPKYIRLCFGTEDLDLFWCKINSDYVFYNRFTNIKSEIYQSFIGEIVSERECPNGTFLFTSDEVPAGSTVIFDITPIVSNQVGIGCFFDTDKTFPSSSSLRQLITQVDGSGGAEHIIIPYTLPENYTYVGVIWGKLKVNSVYLASSPVAKSDVYINGLPGWIETKAREVYSRLIDWVGDSESVFLLGHITDLHSGGNRKFEHLEWLSRLNDLFSFNVLVNNGDIGLDYKSGETVEESMTTMLEVKRRMLPVCPWIYCKGNHERNMPDNKLGLVFSGIGGGTRVFGDSKKLYGYLDYPEFDSRVYFLNTSDVALGTHLGMSDAQLRWFVDSLNSITGNTNVIILTHESPSVVGNNKGVTTLAAYRQTLGNIIKAARNKTSGTTNGISYNFTGKSFKIVICLSGHAHFNKTAVEDGVNFVVRKGYGSISNSNVPDGATVYELFPSSQVSFDVLAVKCDSGEGKIFRIGAGGEDLDYSFMY